MTVSVVGGSGRRDHGLERTDHRKKLVRAFGMRQGALLVNASASLIDNVSVSRRRWYLHQYAGCVVGSKTTTCFVGLFGRDPC